MRALLTLLLSVLLAGVAHAEDAVDDPLPRGRLYYSNFLAVRYNPLGLVDRVNLGYRHRLYRREGLLFGDTFIEAGVKVLAAPTFLSAGPRIEVKPLAILTISGTWAYIGYFGALDTVQSFDTPRADYWERRLSNAGDMGEHYATQGSRADISATLQGKAGPIALRNTVSFVWFDLDLRGDDTFFYDATYDLLALDRGWMVQNDLDVLGLVGKSILGVRYSYADALYGKDVEGVGNEPNHRVGPLFAYEFKRKPSDARFNKPTLLLLAQWHVTHPFRTGRRRSQGIPLIALAFQFEGELWRTK